MDNSLLVIFTEFERLFGLIGYNRFISGIIQWRELRRLEMKLYRISRLSGEGPPGRRTAIKACIFPMTFAAVGLSTTNLFEPNSGEGHPPGYSVLKPQATQELPMY